MTTTETRALEPDSPYVASIRLDRDSPVPLYHQIAQPLSDLISAGKLPSGQLLEDEVTMAHRLRVSRPTARRALQELVSRGLVVRRRGAGTRVTPSHVHRPLGLTSLNDDLERAGYKPRTEVLSYEVLLADERQAALLKVETGAEIARVRRLRFIDDSPLAILSNLMPREVAPTLRELSEHGLYACFRRAGVKLASAEQAIGARLAGEDDAQRLDLEAGAALLTMQRTAYDEAGQIVEYGDHVYSAALYSFRFNLFA